MSPTSAAGRARLVHLALMASVVIGVVVLQLVPTAGLPDPELLLYAVFAVAAVMFAGAMILASRLPREGGGNTDQWWETNLARALVVWIMFESPSLLGAVAGFLTGRPVVLTVPAVGLVLLALHGPERLRQS